MWTGGQVWNSKETMLSYFISSSKSVDCGQEAVFLFYVFFVICNLKNLDKNVDRWTSNKNSEKII